MDQLREEGKVLYFQDLFSEASYEIVGCCDDGERRRKRKRRIDPSEIFFELANAAVVGFKIDCDTSYKEDNNDKSSPDKETTVGQGSNNIIDGATNNSKDCVISKPSVLIRQDNACQTHTGGIVWETAYLLACYLITKNSHEGGTICKNRKPLGKTLEVGSGCGMLGLVVAASGLCKKVVMTETKDVMPNLITNVKYNTSSSNSLLFCSSNEVSARQLRWDAYKDDIKECQSGKTDDGSCSSNNHDLDPHSFDTIIGTDVIFSTKLIRPLLKTLRKMSNDDTNIYLCVQVRCADSHELLFKKAPKYGFVCVDRTEDLNAYPSCSFGLELECKLLHLVRTKKKAQESENLKGK